jgi:hypothetical protein
MLPPVKSSLTPLVLITNFKRILYLYTVYTVYLYINVGTLCLSKPSTWRFYVCLQCTR